MRIRQKTALVISIILAGLTILVLLLVGSIMYSTSRHNEIQMAFDRLMQANGAINNQISALLQTTTDYASWDDTYAYVKDRNPAFIESNFVDETFAKNRFWFVIITDTNGAVIYNKTYDLHTETTGPVSPDILGLLAPGNPLIQHDDVESAKSGFITATAGLFQVASRPILTSSYEGPIRGTLVFGRLFDECEVKLIADITHLPIEIIPTGDGVTPTELPAMGPDGLTTRILSPSTIAAFKVMKDVADKPAFVLRVACDRSHLSQAVVGFVIFTALLIVVVTAATLLTLAMLHRLVIRRLGDLDAFVQSVGTTREFSVRFPVTGQDELTALGMAFNGMLERMQQSIAAQQKTAIALSESERVFSTLLSNLPGMAYRCANDRDWTVIFVSDGSRGLTGYEPSELENNRVVSYNSLINPDDQKSTWDNVQAALRDKRPYQLSYRIKRKDGQLRWIWEHGRGVFGPTGELLFLEGYNADVTDHRQADDDRRRLETQLLQSQKLESLGLLAGGIAHDFNNLLMAILGNADLTLAELPPDSPLCSNLHDITEAGRRAAELCRQLLAFTGRGRSATEPVDLSRMVREMGHLFAVSMSKKVSLDYRLAENLPTVEADASQVHQVIMNMVINASEAIGDHEGMITLVTGAGRFGPSDFANSYPAEAPPGDYVFVEVADTGCGMDAMTIPRIFDPFFSTKFTGRGLGLAAVLGIVRSHKGCITVASEPGRGTTFRVFIPASGKALAPENDLHQPAAWKGRGTVLLVDDEKSARDVAARMLRNCGLTVIEAVDGSEAIRSFMAGSDTIDCVVLDLNMPHMNGEETYRELARIRPDVKVVLSSGYEDEQIMSRFAGQKIAGFVHKPYTLQELVGILKNILGQA